MDTGRVLPFSALPVFLLYLFSSDGENFDFENFNISDTVNGKSLVRNTVLSRVS